MLWAFTSCHVHAILPTHTILPTHVHQHSPPTQIALLQPAPETVALFDDVLLLSDGHIVYHGPVDDVLPYFQGLGFFRPPDVSMQEWVQELTGPVDQKVRCDLLVGWWVGRWVAGWVGSWVGGGAHT